MREGILRIAILSAVQLLANSPTSSLQNGKADRLKRSARTHYLNGFLLANHGDSVLRNRIECSHSLGIRLKRALRHDQVGELRCDVHIGLL